MRAYYDSRVNRNTLLVKNHFDGAGLIQQSLTVQTTCSPGCIKAHSQECKQIACHRHIRRRCLYREMRNSPIEEQAWNTDITQILTVLCCACLAQTRHKRLINAHTEKIEFFQVGLTIEQNHRVSSRDKGNGWALACCCLQFIEWQSSRHMSRIS